MKFFYSVITALVLTMTLVGCHQNEAPKKQAKSWQERIIEIDQEINHLLDVSKSYRQRANEEERKAIIYMRDDWSTYAKKIEAIEQDQQKAHAAEQEISKLKAEKRKLIEENEKK